MAALLEVAPVIPAGRLLRLVHCKVKLVAAATVTQAAAAAELEQLVQTRHRWSAEAAALGEQL
jgi:hypothetical protein